MEIRIPFKTPTINHLYGRHARGFMFVKKEAVELKKEIKEIVKKSLPTSYLEVADSFNLVNGLKVEVEIHEDWFCKNGSVKKKDISNREKFLIDSVFNALDIDDKFIFEQTMKKVQSEKEFALISIKNMEDKNGRRKT